MGYNDKETGGGFDITANEMLRRLNNQYKADKFADKYAENEEYIRSGDGSVQIDISSLSDEEFKILFDNYMENSNMTVNTDMTESTYKSLRYHIINLQKKSGALLVTEKEMEDRFEDAENAKKNRYDYFDSLIESDDEPETIKISDTDENIDAVTEPEAIEEPAPEVVEEPAEEEFLHVNAIQADALISDEEAEASIEIVERDSRSASFGKMCEVNLDTVCNRFDDGETVTLEELKKRRLVPVSAARVKILARGVMTKRLTVIADKFSLQAVKMITLAGGHAEQIK